MELVATSGFAISNRLETQATRIGIVGYAPILRTRDQVTGLFFCAYGGITMNQLGQYTTAQLVEELKRREGVQEMYIEPHIGFDIEAPYQSMSESGPATILVVID